MLLRLVLCLCPRVLCVCHAAARHKSTGALCQVISALSLHTEKHMALFKASESDPLMKTLMKLALLCN